jgi:hypothetical protein
MTSGHLHMHMNQVQTLRSVLYQKFSQNKYNGSPNSYSTEYELLFDILVTVDAN